MAGRLFATAVGLMAVLATVAILVHRQGVLGAALPVAGCVALMTMLRRR